MADRYHVKADGGIRFGIKRGWALSQKGLVANFLRVFPAKFKLDIPAAGGTASVTLVAPRTARFAPGSMDAL